MHIFLRLLICACLRLLYAASSSFLRTIVLFLTVGFADASPAQQRKIPVLWNLQWRNFLIKRSKTTLLRALPIKLAVQVFRMSEASRTNEAEKVEFSRLSIIRLKAYSARKEGKTEPQASRACEWRGFPLKRGRKVPCEVIIRFDYNFIARHFQPAPKRSARGALAGGKSVRKNNERLTASRIFLN